MQNKNIANIFLRIADEMYEAKIDPSTAPRIPAAISLKSNFFSIFPFFIWVINAMDAVGIKEIRLTLWAICWLMPDVNIRTGISIVPPPIPMPLIIPDSMLTIKMSIKTPSLSQTIS